jgi:hypothetical protein
LVVPALVVQESAGRFRAAIEEALEKRRAADVALSRLGVSDSGFSLDVDEQVERYESTLRAKVLGAQGLIPDLPSVELSNLVAKAIRRMRPFDQQGNGFRDAILWEHALSLLEDFDPVVLISNDRVAFHIDKEMLSLAPALAAEVAGLGRGGQGVVLFSDLETYLKSTGTADARTYAAVADIVAAEEVQIGINLEIALGSANIKFRHGQGRIVIEQAHRPASISLVDVTAPDDDDIAFVSLEGDADLDLYVEWWDGTQPDVGSGTKTVTYSASATFDTRKKLLGDLSLATLKVDIDRERFSGLGPLFGSGALWRGDEPLP